MNGASTVLNSPDIFYFFRNYIFYFFRNSEDIVEYDTLNTKMTLTKFRKVSPTMVNVVIMDTVHNNITRALDTLRNRYMIFKLLNILGCTVERGANK